MSVEKQKSEFLNGSAAAPVPVHRSGRSSAAIRVPLDRDVKDQRNKECTPEPFVDAEEAGKFLQLERRRVLQLARLGRLPAYPIGVGLRRVWRFRLSELANAMLHSRQRSHVPEEI
jgi:hypothetical protein